MLANLFHSRQVVSQHRFQSDAPMLKEVKEDQTVCVTQVATEHVADFWQQ